jgi:hypothetical protein
MRRLEIQDADVMRIALQQEIERSDESRYDRRLHGVLLVATGQSCGEVAGLFGEDTRTIQRWVSRFEKHGFDGLREGERPGRPRALEARQWQRLSRDLRRSPRELGRAQNLWDGKLQCAPALGMRDGTSQSPSRPRSRRNVPGLAVLARPRPPCGRARPFGAPRSPTTALRRGQVRGENRHAPHAYLVLRAIASLSLARSV